ncbi:phage tail domain-containing protein [Streptomyces sp. SID14515]|uniref:phage distal tail protein n=1 Tax=Streptomyces sp. SID14515 TaxID=2706074 RepID=UPI0013CA964D|nr:hypothetical protein [Streptomyces sp. SID14515]
MGADIYVSWVFAEQVATTNAVRVSWGPPERDTPALAHLVYIKPSTQTSWSGGELQSLTVDMPAMEHTFAVPGPGTYDVRVRIRYGAGASVYLGRDTAVTVEPPPPPPLPVAPVRGDETANQPYVAQSWTAEFGGVLLGGPSPVVLEEVSGLLDAPEVRSSDKELLQRDGLVPGFDYLGDRTITLEMTVLDPDRNLSDVLAAFVPGGVERPFRFAFPGVAGSDGVLNCRVRKRDIKIDQMHVAGAAKVVVEMAATDPRLYANREEVARVEPPKPRVGTRLFPMRFPLRLRRDGAQVYASRTYLTNRGNTETWPRFKLIGPLLSPAIENKTTGQRLAFDLRLPAGEVLEVDTRRREVLHNGANVFGSVTPDSEWFSFAPGPNSAELEAKQGYEGMFAEARWRSAWL